MNGYRLGIDFGTSSTAAALRRPDGRVESLLFDGSPLLPSAVCVDPDGRLLVGRDALHAALAGPHRFEPHPKRRIDDGVVLLGEAELTVVELIGAVLNRVAVKARRIIGGDPDAVMLTCPVAWGQRRRGSLRAAAAVAGLSAVELLTEPVAAATYFTGSGPTGRLGARPLLVYDLGAGTFDASVVRHGGAGFEVLASRGLDDVGGLDIDAAIVAHLGATYAAVDPATWRRLVVPVTSEDQRAARQLWEHVRTGKEALSRLGSTLVHLPLLDRDAPLGREHLDQLSRPVIDRTLAATRAVLYDAGVAPDALAGVLLVGGGSRLPLVASALHHGLGVAATVVEQPELVVAEGSLLIRPDVDRAPVASARAVVDMRPAAADGPALEFDAPAGPGTDAGPSPGHGPSPGPGPSRARRRRLVAASVGLVLLVAVATVTLSSYGEGRFSPSASRVPSSPPAPPASGVPSALQVPPALRVPPASQTAVVPQVPTEPSAPPAAAPSRSGSPTPGGGPKTSYLNVRPARGGPTDAIELKGGRFPQWQQISVRIAVPGGYVSMGPATTNGEGTFIISFDPRTAEGADGRLSPGTHLITADWNDDPSYHAETKYTVRSDT